MTGWTGPGVMIHQYGPHIFHTGSKRVYDYLSRFTGWRDYQHRVLARYTPDGGARARCPSTSPRCGRRSGRKRGLSWKRKLVGRYGAETKVSILKLREDEDPEIRQLADYVYEHVFVHYTVKQWGTPPEEIDPATIARVPVFLSPGTTGISRTPTRGFRKRGTPPSLRSCWPIRASRWS